MGPGLVALTYSATYVGEDIAPIAIDALGGVLAAFASFATIIGLIFLIMWIQA